MVREPICVYPTVGHGVRLRGEAARRRVGLARVGSRVAPSGGIGAVGRRRGCGVGCRGWEGAGKRGRVWVCGRVGTVSAAGSARRAPAGGSPVGAAGTGEGEDAATVTLSITSIIDFQP